MAHAEVLGDALYLLIDTRHNGNEIFLIMDRCLPHSKKVDI